MLCRVADSLFWMSRYVERAENTARLVEVNLQLLLDSEALRNGRVEAYWGPMLHSTGDRSIYDGLYDEINSQNVMEFLTFNSRNPSSIISCVKAARENARMIRDQITEEMWETLNRLYHYIKKTSQFPIGHSGLYDSFRQVKEYSSLFVGITESTYNHQVGYEFMRAGRYLERAEKTGRIIDSKQHLLEYAEDQRSAAIIEWGAVLRATSAFPAYQQAYRSDVRPLHVLELLISSRNFPRAMLFCLNELQRSIHAISGCPVTHYSNEAERLCGRLISQLNYTSMQEMVERGVHEFLVHVQKEIEKITVELSQQYMFFPVIDPAAEEEAAA